jgi:hypothetical protein
MPIIVTAQLDSASAARWDILRKTHFPAERNFLAAHLTLFHQLDEHQAGAMMRRPMPNAVPLEFNHLRFLGQGVAVAVVSQSLLALRANLAAAVSTPLSRQDQQSFRPHITIQNKVDPSVARALFNELSATFELSSGICVGVQLWDYLGGPWRLRTTLPLVSADAPPVD